MRQSRFKKRTKDLEQPPDRVAKLPAAMVYEGLGRNCRMVAQYTLPELRWEISIGSTCSTGGARAPISEVSTDLGYEVGRFSVDLTYNLVSPGYYGFRCDVLRY